MELEKTFDGTMERGLRVRGTRIGVDLLVAAFKDGLSPEQIVHQYHPALTLQQVYEAIACYLEHQPAIDAYCARLDEEQASAVAEQEANPSDGVRRLRELKRRRREAA